MLCNISNNKALQNKQFQHKKILKLNLLQNISLKKVSLSFSDHLVFLDNVYVQGPNRLDVEDRQIKPGFCLGDVGAGADKVLQS